jgi:large subunit ribosomal protein L33
MARAPKETTFLVSSSGTGYFYINRKNKKKIKGDKKMAIKKYDPKLRKHVLFEEKKLSKAKKKTAAPAAKGAEAAAKGEAAGKSGKAAA